MSRVKKKPKKEFSKLILICAGAVTVLVTAFTFIMVWRTNDLSPLAYLIPAVFTELGVGTGILLFQSQGRKPDQIAEDVRPGNLQRYKGDVNHAGSYYEQPDQYWVGNADLLGGVPVQCGLFPVLQYQNFASAF
jgi:hypothetical protein